jgi:hypothetical protein
MTIMHTLFKKKGTSNVYSNYIENIYKEIILLDA